MKIVGIVASSLAADRNGRIRMETRTKLVAVILGGALILGATDASLAELGKDEQKCLDTYLNKMRLVSAARNKENRRCIKSALKGKPPGAGDVDGCLDLDPRGKVAKKIDKAFDATEIPNGKCDPVVGTPVPAVGHIFSDSGTGADAHVAGAVALARGIFDDPIFEGPLNASGSGKCQDRLFQRAHQIFDAKMKEFRKCAKAGMKAGTIVDNATLEAVCMSSPGIPDPKNKIQKKIDKLTAAISQLCLVGPFGPIPVAIGTPGECAGEASWADAAACLERLVECKVCRTLNVANNTSRDCDLFDDGLPNDSCQHYCGDGEIDPLLGEECDGSDDAACPAACQFDCSCGSYCGDGQHDPELGEECDGGDDAACPGACQSDCSCAPGIGAHQCTLSSASGLTAHAVLPLPSMPLSGAIEVSCGATGPTGSAPCTCDVQTPFAPISFAGLGWLCIGPPASGACASGRIDCDGGDPLGVDVNGNRNIGSCTSNADCAADCAALCSPQAVLDAGCEGFCTEGSQSSCTTDLDCLVAGEGACNGPDGVGWGNICDCTCVGEGSGPASTAGDLACNLGLNLTLEPSPGNGLACDGADVAVDLGDTCFPLSTQFAGGIVSNGNNLGVEFPPGGFVVGGTPFSCAALAGGSTSGAVLGGAAVLYATTIGDQALELELVCQ